MKLSKYNHVLKYGDSYILYNSLSDELVAMAPEVYSLLAGNSGSLGAIQKRHPDFYGKLISMRSIVDDDCDEARYFMDKWKREDENADTFHVILNVTVDCNMKCWYCYVRKKKYAMDGPVAASVLRLIERQCHDDKYRNVMLSFFGGEPLLHYDDKVLPLIRGVRAICSRYGKCLFLHFTTNGYLIDEGVLTGLSGLPVSFQITLDGNSHIHNRTRILRGGDGSDDVYGRTASNIRLCLKHGFPTMVRLNFTSKTLPYFQDIGLDFKDLPAKEKDLLTYNFQKVWQDACSGRDPDIQGRVRDIEASFLSKGFNVAPYTSNAFGRCYADSRHCVVINHDGMVFKCTARDFRKSNSDGIIGENGDIAWNANNRLRNDVMFCGKACRECRIYPLCHGGCSQLKMENKSRIDTCFKGLTEEDKDRIVLNRVRDMLDIHAMKLRKSNGSGDASTLSADIPGLETIN